MGGLMAQGSLAWKHPSYPPTKTLKAAPSVRNIMVTVFWNDKGVLLVDFLDRIDNVTVKRYCSTVERFRQAIRPRRPGLLRKAAIILHDNARAHSTNRTCDWLRLEGHSPNSPYLTHSDFRLFGPLEKHMSGKRFATDADVKQAVTSWPHALDADFFYARLQAFSR